MKRLRRIKRSSQLRIGMRVESEHKSSLKFIKNYHKRTGRFPSDKMIYARISLDHLREDPSYYKKLRKAKL